MSATAMYGRDVRYRRRLEVLGRLFADMGWRRVYADLLATAGDADETRPGSVAAEPSVDISRTT
jgi:hypothetical protein